jgi:putative copper export protein
MISPFIPYYILVAMFGSIFLFTFTLIVTVLVANIIKRYRVKPKKKDHLRLVKK